MIAELEIMVFPPSMMFCAPAMVALRDTLFPVSCNHDGTSRSKRFQSEIPFLYILT